MDGDRADRAEELLARWQEHGDAEALDALLREEVGALKRRLARGGQDHSSVTASDIAQEATLRLLEARPRLASPAALRAYLWTTARNLLVDRLRRSRRVVLEVGDDETRTLQRDPATSGGFGEVERGDLRAALELALNLLRPADQEILQRVYFRSLSIEQAAEELAIAREVANTRLVRARVRLAEKLAAWRELVES